jgi:hypothetical protein
MSPVTTMMGGASTHFGASVSSAGDIDGDGYADVVVGAPGTASVRGSAYLYRGSASGLMSGTAIASPDGPGTLFGSAVSDAGDINDDGFGDVLVSAPAANSNTGVARLYLGSATGLRTMMLLGTGAAGELFGQTLACAGDVDGDGLADLAVGAPLYNASTGRVYVYPGRAVPGVPITIAGPDGPNAAFGSALAAGDVDGDGYSDLAVGEYAWANNSNTGQVRLYSGAHTAPLQPRAMIPGTYPIGAAFGIAIGCSDFNGDGFADLAIGADGVNASSGRVEVFAGSVSPFMSMPVPIIPPSMDGGQFGHSIASATRCRRVDGLVRRARAFAPPRSS